MDAAPPPSSAFPNHLQSTFCRSPDVSLRGSGGAEALPRSMDAQAVADDTVDGLDEEFEFDFRKQLDRAHEISDAGDLFYGGKIRPLGGNHSAGFKKSPEKSQKEAAREQSHGGGSGRIFDSLWSCSSSSSSSSGDVAQRGSRSFSHFRVSGSREDYSKTDLRSRKSLASSSASSSSSSSSSANSSSSISSSISSALARGSRRWGLRDFLLFRSASEGRASTRDDDPLRKYYAPLLPLKKKNKKSSEAEAEAETEDLKAESFRSTESAAGPVNRRRSRPGGSAISAHEQHYRTNRATYEEMRKKTFLPYRQGLLGCLGFSSIDWDLGSLTRG